MDGSLHRIPGCISYVVRNGKVIVLDIGDHAVGTDI